MYYRDTKDKSKCLSKLSLQLKDNTFSKLALYKTNNDAKSLEY